MILVETDVRKFAAGRSLSDQLAAPSIVRLCSVRRPADLNLSARLDNPERAGKQDRPLPCIYTIASPLSE